MIRVSVDVAKMMLSKEDNMIMFMTASKLAKEYNVPYNHKAFVVIINQGVLVGLTTVFDRVPCIRDIRLQKARALTLENG